MLLLLFLLFFLLELLGSVRDLTGHFFALLLALLLNLGHLGFQFLGGSLSLLARLPLLLLSGLSLRPLVVIGLAHFFGGLLALARLHALLALALLKGDQARREHGLVLVY